MILSTLWSLSFSADVTVGPNSKGVLPGPPVFAGAMHPVRGGSAESRTALVATVWDESKAYRAPHHETWRDRHSWLPVRRGCCPCCGTRYTVVDCGRGYMSHMSGSCCFTYVTCTAGAPDSYLLLSCCTWVLGSSRTCDNHHLS